ncbi:MAG: DUF362 domain-containing protein [Gemmatimonadetes bacterium]|jgi:uncharacterized protein (DUF362 family)|nr:DUF362 domain-containing protein [Gemmatimonadota bacterium]MBT6146178.1 DUF362 domain-containing protein [Gemmatimonadota bacterium]MBT7859540.1 DUF362 domain-containing protein [Gemmatimonadota bacterium]
MSSYHVRAMHCDHLATEDEVYETLVRATAPLTDTWERLAKAKRIGIKINQDEHPDEQVQHAGMLQQLVCDKVVRATLRLLRERTTAEIVCTDVSFYAMYNGKDPIQTATALPALKEYGVEYVVGHQAPTKIVPVPGGGQMFSQYLLPEPAVDVDEFVSLAKMKNHAFMGVTLSLKNLFGLMPGEPRGHARPYYHHLVRMPYMLADLGRIFNPTLNIIDGLIGQAGQEWGNGVDESPAVVANALVAGDHTIATDACATWLMGHDPTSDWLTPPFHRDRNSLKAAAEAGFGTVDLEQIDFESEVDRPLGAFFANLTDTMEIVHSWQRTTCEQGLFYRDHRQDLFDQYAGQYVLLQEGEVRWYDEVSDLQQSRRKLSGDNPEQAMYLKFVDPDEAEGEHFGVYERGLERFDGERLRA